MKSMFLKSVCAGLCFASLIHAEEAKANEAQNNCNYGFASVQLDQDLFLEAFPLVDHFPKAFTENEDRDYTMGLSLSFFACPDSANPLTFFSPQRRVSELFLGGDDYVKSYITTIGTSAYTPDELNNPEPILTDRPYASLLYLNNSYIVSSADRNSALETTISIGVLGLGIADKAQTWIHQENRKNSGLDTPYDPLGWHNQIADGGQPTAMLSVGWMKRLTPPSKHFDVVGSTQINLGYITSANVGLMARAGCFRQGTPVENTIKHGGGGHGSVSQTVTYDGTAKCNKWELFAFGGARASVVGYNVLLQGQFGDDPHSLDHSQIRHFVYDYTVGAGVTYKKARLQLYCATRSSEHFLEVQRSHSWCGTNFAFGF